MTSSQLAGPRDALGAQRPRLESFPAYVSSSGQEAIELAALAGLDLDEWQQYVLLNALGERLDGRWAAFEVGVCVPRQNGKGGILEARELAGLYLLGEGLIIHSAHQFDTSLEAFRRLLDLVEGRDEFTRRVKRVSRSHGEEGIELYGPPGRRVSGGQRIRFRTRTKGGGRGFSGDCVIFDEPMILPVASHSAILPIVSAKPNPQVWYTGSAVDQLIHEDGFVWARVRRRGLDGSSSLAYFEWSVDADDPDTIPAEVLSDEHAWAVANPALGIRITAEHIGNELESMIPRSFAVERLGVGDWPSLEDGDSVIGKEAWGRLASSPVDVNGPAFAFDVSPDRAWASIAAAGTRPDSFRQVEVIEHRKMGMWLIPRIVEIGRRHGGRILCDARGPAGALLPELEQSGVTVEAVSSAELAQACGLFYDGVDQQTLRHLGDPLLANALTVATRRKVGEVWTWSRSDTSVDLSPLFAVTLAHFGLVGGAAQPWASGW